MLRRWLLMLCVAVAAVHCDVFYLPKNVKPLRYDITIEPNFTNVGSNPSLFWGAVTIQLKALESTNNITLHAIELDIDDSSIQVLGSFETIPVKSTLAEPEDQLYIINLQKPLAPQQIYNLTIGNYTGIFQTNSRGLFKATYGPPENLTMIAVTQFEPNLARYAFPCFDEPGLKAKFVINTIRSKDYNSVSNEDLERTEKLDENRFKDVFKETPIMPTYSVAFAISDFKSTERKERHRFFAQAKAFETNELELPLDLSIKTLELLEEFLGLKYTLSKIDSFAIPQGFFNFFAMENWGLITYREERLRFSNITNVYTQRRATTYIAHEFAHQWFGNLVTHASWEYIWVTEAFAEYFQYFIASKARPSWRLMDIFVMEIVQASFYDEQTAGSFGLRFEVTRNGQFLPFHILYQKGGALVWMMSHFLTPDIFRKALHDYILENQFKNVVSADLYNSVQKTIEKENVNDLLGNMSFGEIFETWETLDGYPVVNVIRNYATGEVVLTQAPELTSKNNVWKIPINYVISTRKLNFEDTKADVWLTNKTMTIQLDKDGWLVLNKQRSGYYRVNYDEKNWERIIQVLKSDHFEDIHVLSRAQLINDAFYLASKNYLPIDVPFRLSEYLVEERDYIPFASFMTSLWSFCDIFTGRTNPSETNYFLNHPLRKNIKSTTGNYTEDFLTLQEYIRTITFNVRHYLGKEPKPNEPFLDTINRIEIDRYFPYNFDD
ncbi:hypothetical protein FQR65_LT05469 [Abscondita terminalis]|nr:hypothetical protein FQR65_LT05469 [Abscondita terminalis]